MRIGIPREIKTLEGRVGMVPEACSMLVEAGHEVFVQQGAGEKSGFPDELFRRAGVTLLPDAAAVYEKAQMIVKVKEPVDPEIDLLRKDHILFSYLHLAAAPQLMECLLKIGLTAVAFETVEERGRLPLLAPMSDIAGRLSVQVGTHLLHQVQGGKGLLLGGLPAAPRGHVVVVGGGVAGGNAARMAAGLGAQVTVFDRNRDRLEEMRAIGPNVTALFPYPTALHDAVVKADLLVGAVLLIGAKAPHVVTEKMVSEMEKGSVIVDISVDQGGCIETTRPTTYKDPTYVTHGVTHFCVTNMPGAVPRTSSQALSASVAPYVLELAKKDWRANPALKAGINLEGGKIVHPALQ